MLGFIKEFITSLNNEQNTPVSAILGNADVKQMIQRFTENDMPDTSHALIIWVKNGQVGYNSAGFQNEFEAGGVLTRIAHSIEHNGLNKL